MAIYSKMLELQSWTSGENETELYFYTYEVYVLIHLFSFFEPVFHLKMELNWYIWNIKINKER